MPPLLTLPDDVTVSVGPPLGAGGVPLSLVATLPSEAVTPVRKSATACELGDVELLHPAIQTA